MTGSRNILSHKVDAVRRRLKLARAIKMCIRAVWLAMLSGVAILVISKFVFIDEPYTIAALLGALILVGGVAIAVTAGITKMAGAISLDRYLGAHETISTASELLSKPNHMLTGVDEKALRQAAEMLKDVRPEAVVRISVPAETASLAPLLLLGFVLFTIPPHIPEKILRERAMTRVLQEQSLVIDRISVSADEKESWISGESVEDKLKTLATRMKAVAARPDEKRIADIVAEIDSLVSIIEDEQTSDVNDERISMLKAAAERLRMTLEDAGAMTTAKTRPLGTVAAGETSETSNGVSGTASTSEEETNSTGSTDTSGAASTGTQREHTVTASVSATHFEIITDEWEAAMKSRDIPSAYREAMKRYFSRVEK